MQVMLKSLREERKKTYSIFLPIHPETGRVLYVPIKNVDVKNYTISFDDEDGKPWTLPVTGGNVKFQWKPDFGARWAALGWILRCMEKTTLPIRRFMTEFAKY